MIPETSKKSSAYLTSGESVPILTARTQFSEQSFLDFLRTRAGQKPSAEVAIALSSKDYEPFLKALKNSTRAKRALEKHNIRRIYFWGTDAPSKLAAFDVTGEEVVKASATEPPSCGD